MPIHPKDLFPTIMKKTIISLIGILLPILTLAQKPEGYE